jgi:hypothetical protein
LADGTIESEDGLTSCAFFCLACILFEGTFGLVCCIKMPGMIFHPTFTFPGISCHDSYISEREPVYLSSFPFLLTILSNKKLGTKIPKLIIPPTNRKFASVDLGLSPLGTYSIPFLLLHLSLCLCCVFKCPSLSKCGTSFSSPCPNGDCPGPIPPLLEGGASAPGAPVSCAARRLADCSPHPPLL